MILNLPNDLLWTETTSTPGTGDGKDPMTSNSGKRPPDHAPQRTENANRKDPRLDRDSAEIYRNVVDFEFRVNISDSALPARKIIVEALQHLRSNDPSCLIFSVDRSEHFAQPGDLPKDAETIQRDLQFRKIRKSSRHQSLIFSLYLETTLRITDHRRKSPELSSLQDSEKLYMRPRTLGTPDTTVLGWLAKAHPKATHYQAIEKALAKSLQKAPYDPNERRAWEHTLNAQEKLAFENNNAPVPPIRVFKGTKRVELNNEKRLIEVLNIKVATAHKNWVFHLLCRASDHDLLPCETRFIPNNIHPKSLQYPGVVNGHLNFVKDLRLIPIVGLSHEAANLTRPDAEDKPITYLNHITKKMSAITIQPTSRTPDIGKWIVITRSKQQELTQKFIDREIPRTFLQDIPEDKFLTGFTYPRRTQIPLDTRAMGTYAEKLEQMAAQGAALPQISVQNPWKKPKEVFIIDDSQQFPELRRTTAQRNQKQPPSDNKPHNRDLHSIQQRPRRMEHDQEQRLKEIEQKHKTELEEVMESFQNQQKQAMESMERRIQTSHDTLKTLIEHTQHSIFAQMNDLMKVVQAIADQLPQQHTTQYEDSEMAQGSPQKGNNRPTFDSLGTNGKKSKTSPLVPLRPATLGTLVTSLKQLSENTVTPEKPRASPNQAADESPLSTPGQDQSQNATHTKNMATETFNEWY